MRRPAHRHQPQPRAQPTYNEQLPPPVFTSQHSRRTGLFSLSRSNFLSLLKSHCSSLSGHVQLPDQRPEGGTQSSFHVVDTKGSSPQLSVTHCILAVACSSCALSSRSFLRLWSHAKRERSGGGWDPLLFIRTLPLHTQALSDRPHPTSRSPLAPASSPSHGPRTLDAAPAVDPAVVSPGPPRLTQFPPPRSEPVLAGHQSRPRKIGRH